MPRPLQVMRDGDEGTFTPAPCPRCSSTRVGPELSTDEPFGLQCSDCGWVGPRMGTDDNPDAAATAWRHEADQVSRARKLNLNLHFDQPVRKVSR